MTHRVFSSSVAQLRYFTRRLRKCSNVSHLANKTILNISLRARIAYTSRELRYPYQIKMPVLSQCLPARKLAADNGSTQAIQAFASRITEVKKHNYVI
ncbi:hypothetical protein F7P06_05950 [Klebsiella pneumoniae]|nr:hypothetical protein F7P06_05950 [Klebsiella pneumoniae]